jgi:hemoglobin
MMEKSLYERLGGVFAIAAVINRFSDEVVKNRVTGEMSQNPAFKEWHTKELERLPGLKWMRTLWFALLQADLSNTQGQNQEAHRWD